MKRWGRTRFTDEQVKQLMLKNIQIDKNDCWNWTLSRHPRGYGHVKYQRRSVLAHRLSMHFFRDFNLDSPSVICHRCDNPSCINPDHLFVGTQADNLRLRDMMKKERKFAR